MNIKRLLVWRTHAASFNFERPIPAIPPRVAWLWSVDEYYRCLNLNIPSVFNKSSQILSLTERWTYKKRNGADVKAYVLVIWCLFTSRASDASCNGTIKCIARTQCVLQKTERIDRSRHTLRILFLECSRTHLNCI